MAGFGDKPFGLRQVNVVNSLGTVYAALPAAQTLKFNERVESAELPGNDAINAVVAFVNAVEWELESGGISLEAYAIMTGRTPVVSSTTPNRTYSMYGRGGDVLPYFKIYGKALGDGPDDVHVKIFKAKITDDIEGEFAGGDYFVTKCKGVAVDNGVAGEGIFQFVQHETAAALPTT